MTHPSKVKGDKWERDVVRFLQSSGVPIAERIRAGARDDLGDIWHPHWTIEAKNAKRIELGPWLDETVTEQCNRHTPWHALWIKRRLHGASMSFVVMTGSQAAAIMRVLP